jgi:tetratricopeptide (TPR) repeat protein
MQSRRSLRRSLLLALTLLSACAAAPPAAPAAGGGDLLGSGQSAASAFLVGHVAATRGDLDFAATEFLLALAREPADPMLRQQAFLACLMSGRPEALRLARTLPGNQAAELLLANHDAMAGDWAAAQRRFAALSGPPGTQQLTDLMRELLVAWSEAGAGKTDAALATLHPFAPGAQPQFLVLLHAALIADLAHRTAEAERLYARAQSEFGAPTLELARLLASWQSRQGHPEAAAAMLEASIARTPNLAIALPALLASAQQPVIRSATDGLAEVYLALAASLHQQDGGAVSLAMIRLALTLRPDDAPARLLGSDLAAMGKHYEEALRLLAPIPASDPLASVVRLHRATLAELAGHPEQALQQLQALARDYPDRPEPYIGEADILRAQHHFKEAAATYDKAIARLGTPTAADWSVFYNRGIARDRAKDWPGAQQDFLTALKLAPNEPYVLNYLGYSWTEQGRNLSQARQMIERAVAERPNDGAIVDSLGWLLLRQGDVGAAVQKLQQAAEMVPEDPTINGHLGDAYWAAGRQLEAFYQWRLALTLHPDAEETARISTRLHEAEQALGIPPTSAAPSP